LVTLAAVAVGQKWQKKVVASVIFAHPTLDEALESAIVNFMLPEK
jgi:dihydrolipoamide dehydrogenase